MRWQNLLGKQLAARRSSHCRNASVGPRNRQLQLELLEARQLLTADLTVIAAGIDNALGDIDSVVAGADVLGKNIPFFGSNLQSSDAADFVSDLRDAIDDKMNGAETLVSQIESALTDAFNTMGVDSFTITPTDSATLTTFDVVLSDTLATESITYNTGLPGLDLALTGSNTIDVDVTYTLDFTFGANNSTFFFETTASNEEVKVAVAIADTTGLNADADLGLLKLKVSDNGSNLANASLVVDVQGNAGALTYDPKFTAEAEMRLLLQTEGSGIAAAVLPKLESELNFDWTFSSESTQTSDLGFGTLGAVTFDNVSLDLGSFYGQYAEPILDKVSQVVEPLKPVVQLLTTKIPGFSDIGPIRNAMDFDNDGKVTLLDIAEVFKDDTKPFDTSFVQALANVVEIVTLLDGAKGAGFDGTPIPLGSFEFQPGGSMRWQTRPRRMSRNRRAEALPAWIVTANRRTRSGGSRASSRRWRRSL